MQIPPQLRGMYEWSSDAIDTTTHLMYKTCERLTIQHFSISQGAHKIPYVPCSNIMRFSWRILYKGAPLHKHNRGQYLLFGFQTSISVVQFQLLYTPLLPIWLVERVDATKVILNCFIFRRWIFTSLHNLWRKKIIKVIFDTSVS